MVAYKDIAIAHISVDFDSKHCSIETQWNMFDSGFYTALCGAKSPKESSDIIASASYLINYPLHEESNFKKEILCPNCLAQDPLLALALI